MKRIIVFMALVFTIATTSFGQTVMKQSPKNQEHNGFQKQKKHDGKAGKAKGNSKYDKHKHKHKHKHMHHKKK